MSSEHRLPGKGSRAHAVLVCVLSFLAVQALDWEASPAVPLGVYFLLPVAVAAWYLDRTWTTAVVVAASAWRTLILGRQVQHGDTLVYALDALTSLVLFGGAAMLLASLRRSQRLLAVQADQLRAQARIAEERLRLQWSIRRAVPSDVDAIVALTVLGAETGDLSKDVLNAVHQQVLRVNYANCIQSGEGGRRTWYASQATVPIEFWVAEIDGELAGFFMVMGVDEKRGSERELHAIVTAQQHRGRGVGSAMLDFFCAHYVGRRAYVACKPGSRMHRMLTQRGFTLYATTQEGYVIVERTERRAMSLNVPAAGPPAHSTA